jgi:cytosolic carboxypeptidase protein 2/3
MHTHLNELKLLHTQFDHKFIRFESIGKSIGGINIPIIKISNPERNTEPPEYRLKEVIVIIGRQHSGETHSSFIIHGLINFLVSNNVKAFKLRSLFEWWILPIVNPDGVITGNYRTNLQGKDMNRQFFADGDPMADKKGRCIEVELLRTYLKENIAANKLRMFLDVHAHSTESSIMVYSPQPEDVRDIVTTRSFAILLDDASVFFQLSKCSFNNEKYKKNCARLGIFRDFNTVNSYTIETSCFGFDTPGPQTVKEKALA